jgi:hypothetical protein
MTMSPLLASRIRINDDVLSQDLNGEVVLLNLKTGVYFGLDPIGSRVWELLAGNAEVARILEVLLSEYDVPRDRCSEDLVALITKLQEHQLVTVAGFP